MRNYLRRRVYLLNEGAIPRASFARTVYQAVEGGGGIMLDIIFNSAFNGTLNYAVSSTSLATAGEDYTALSGTIAVDGYSAAIPLAFPDDLTLESDETLEIRITEGTGYVPGAPSDTTVFIADNDAVWKGVITRQLTSGIGFDLVLLRNGDTVTGHILGDESGMIPPSDPPGAGWPLQNVTATESTLNMVVTGIPVPGQYTERLGASFTRSFEFSYEAREKDTVLNTLTEIAGKVTERLEPEDPVFSYLATEYEGAFMLKKVPGDVDVEEAPLEDEK
jgi:hypothetical protein